MRSPLHVIQHFGLGITMVFVPMWLVFGSKVVVGDLILGVSTFWAGWVLRRLITEVAD